MALKQKELENYLEMFASEGWKQLAEDVVGQIEAHKDALVGDKESRDIFYRQGVIDALRIIHNLPASVEARIELLREEEADADV